MGAESNKVLESFLYWLHAEVRPIWRSSESISVDLSRLIETATKHADLLALGWADEFLSDSTIGSVRQIEIEPELLTLWLTSVICACGGTIHNYTDTAVMGTFRAAPLPRTLRRRGRIVLRRLYSRRLPFTVLVSRVGDSAGVEVAAHGEALLMLAPIMEKLPLGDGSRPTTPVVIAESLTQ